MPGRKKLGIVRKVLAKVGKHIMWTFSKKLNRLFLTGCWKSVMLKFSELNENDAKKASKIWFEIGKAAGDSLMYAWLDRGKMIFSKKLEDMKVVVETAWYSFLGDHTDDIRYYEAGDGYEVPRIVWRFWKCWMCSGVFKDEDLKHLDLENLHEYGYGAAAAGIFETALQMVQDYVDNPYSVVCRETKCFCRGDDYQEFTAYFYPKQEEEII